MADSDKIVDALKRAGQAEAMAQAYSVLAAVADTLDGAEVPQVVHALNYFGRRAYDPDFTLVAGVKRNRENLLSKLAQAYQVIGSLADACGTFGDYRIVKVLDYFGNLQVYDDNFLPWEAPKAGIDGIEGIGGKTNLKKVGNDTSSTMLRYAVTPAGESCGEFVRVLLERSAVTGLTMARTPEGDRVFIAKAQIGDVLADLPGALGEYFWKRYGRPVTVERVDWPHGHVR